ncbi:hypothetical protein [Pseudodonghicola xiamenensis]|uniref:Uncharacterized protein n=1 Tax=Pseudodonghicola xiamenensis TaxID=337702 RepID=A0A8J3MC22_9RHOB|nr:hypothetical protein [Pseudodonghicola xiamenensis]GHG88946.1 hypothetical protein GCM10010961_18380 [Pseudodonghicola xiamenensis]
MSDPRSESRPGDRDRSTPLGMYARPSAARLSGIELTAGALSLIWLAGSALYLLTRPASGETAVDGLRFVVTLMAIFLPVAMIWVAATTLRTARVMREESARLQMAVDAIRQAQIAQAQRGAIPADGAIQKKLDEIAATAKKTETALATFHTIRQSEPRPVTPPVPAPARDSDDQAALELGTPAEALSAPLVIEDFVRALHFPETAEDEEGFGALRRTLKDRKAAQLIQAAQDVLTLLSQDGIYMDDLHPDRARPEVWRQFAQGVRGRAVAALGGVRDRSSLALTAARMKQDPIFRDAVHHFLRRFDQMFAAFAEEATDAEITALAETRTARAFMLVGRVAGTFD